MVVRHILHQLSGQLCTKHAFYLTVLIPFSHKSLLFGQLPVDDVVCRLPWPDKGLQNVGPSSKYLNFNIFLSPKSLLSNQTELIPVSYGSSLFAYRVSTCLMVSMCRLLIPWQTIWTQIKTNTKSVLIWIQTVFHSESVDERFFFN